ncbi:unnamed protein product [Caenorhabditis bovis]|uniref:Golgin subfamily A conserved domain-containing protein n=1 Tax=Caenorhabditis bovis TaxID=2654633 RepID=A0A8S1EUM4_9PELO|nr:unnamed protein product [Caenorhabditis bovis]
MNDASSLTKAEMLAAAKKKLKDFESRRNHDSRASPTSSIVSSELGGNGVLSSIKNEDRQLLSISPFQQIGNEWYQAYTQLKAQHDELCSHYAQLHTAYSQISVNGVHVDAENQIIQLQSALSTVVEEKLDCQAELRRTKENLEKILTEFEEFRKEHINKTTESHVEGDESVEIKKLLSKLEQKDNLLSARHSELEHCRREVSEIQAHLLTVQHERSEAQARVRSLVRENNAIEESLKQLRKELQMKDLHLKQLGAHTVEGKEDKLVHLNDQLEILTKSLSDANIEKSKLIAEYDALKKHYSERERALEQKQKEMAVELENIQNHRFSADDRVQQLENQLHLALKDLEKMKLEATLSKNLETESAHDFFNEEDSNRRVREAVALERIELERRLEEEQRRREEEILEKDRMIFERDQLLAEIEMKYRLLEERMLETTNNGADLLSLSEQLQNEKATVSRAVAQNRELKSQLIETEDRLIALTDAKLQLELDKQAAEHQVRELTKQLNLENAGLVPNIAEVIALQPHLESRPNTEEKGTEPMVIEHEQENDELDQIRREYEEMRLRFETAQAELAQVRAELRRSHTQNEQMDQIMRQNAEDENQNSIHVELTQAVVRLNELAAENEQLREAISDLSTRLNGERVRSAEAENKLEEILKMDRQPKDQQEPPPNLMVVQPEASEKEWARKELEKRFSRAMMQNAELTEAIDKLEHVNQQLQLENDTIADHIIVYQHQRRLIRERIRVKDEQLRAMEEERQKTIARCQELQNVLMTVLNKGGILKEYETKKRTTARRVSRSYSHSTVDELSGDEDVIVDAKLDVVPDRSEVSSPSLIATVHVKEQVPNGAASPARSLSPINETEDASVRRILEIISDISKAQMPTSAQLHCTQCIGDIKEI